MNCRDVRDAADLFLCEDLWTDTNHEILRHLDTCPSCRTEIDARRRLRTSLRTAFVRARELQPTAEFVSHLRDQLRQATVQPHRSWMWSHRWLALAAGLVLAVGVAAILLLNRSGGAAETLARDAVGDHRDCALKYRLVREPVPLEEAAQRFDSTYRLLLNAPPDDIPTPDGPAHVLERHSCAYGTHRFGHVILRYRGRVVSLLVTADSVATPAAQSAAALPHVIGRPLDGLSVVSVNASRHAVVLVSDLKKSELTQLAGIVSLPLAERLGSVDSDRAKPSAWLFARPVLELVSSSSRTHDLPPRLVERSPSPAASQLAGPAR